jgi:hypothetical protein
VDNRNLMLFLSSVAALSAAVCIAVSCSDQPKTRCTTGHGRFAASYKAISQVPDGGCALLGEDVGIQSYNSPTADGRSIDVDHASVWIKGKSMTEAAKVQGMEDSTHPINAIGQFASPTPGDDKFCDVTNMQPAEQDLPGTDAGVAPTTIKYAWSNVRFVVAPEALGTQMVADLDYTVDSCSAKYHVTALYPSVDCTGGGTALDFCRCLYYGDPTPEYQRPNGSGISPDLFGFSPKFGDEACDKSEANAQAMENTAKIRCDRVTHLCVLKNDPLQ